MIELVYLVLTIGGQKGWLPIGQLDFVLSAQTQDLHLQSHAAACEKWTKLCPDLQCMMIMMCLVICEIIQMKRPPV